MITESDLSALIRKALPDAEVICDDLTGTQDHWQVTVISDAFEGLRLLAQHRLVKDAIKADMATRVIHAFSLKTYTHAKWAERG
jgi:acid stress-induced BolA-like protein IbaG/YrbA